MKDMFSIEELASYQNISKQTLIYYDKIGLFKPAYIDPDNKYRYYTVKQVDYLIPYFWLWKKWIYPEWDLRNIWKLYHR